VVGPCCYGNLTNLYFGTAIANFAGTTKKYKNAIFQKQ